MTGREQETRPSPFAGLLARRAPVASPADMRRATAFLVLLLGCGAAAAFADGSEPAPVLSSADTHRVRGALAWQRAVWRTPSGHDEFARVVDELERYRADPAGRKDDFTSLFLLGYSYLRLGNVAMAAPALKDAKSLSPKFPGLLLTDALMLTAEMPADPDAAVERAKAALEKYDEYLDRLSTYPKDETFARELRFLGYLFRGRTNVRLVGHMDQAVDDLNQALAVAKEAGEPPAAEVISLLAQTHQNLEQFDAAIKLVREALSRDPAEANHYYNLGLLLNAQHDEAAAQPMFEAALRRRPEFPEAHLKLAYIAWKRVEPVSMRAHLEAADAMYEARSKAGSPSDAGVQADIQAGYGLYWVVVGEKRSDAGDADGATAAYRKAFEHFREAIAKVPGCIQALNVFVQLASRVTLPPEEQKKLDADQLEFKKRLDDLNLHKIEPFHSTFC
jgi:tetratricopeptide (TPR) repeat protein